MMELERLVIFVPAFNEENSIAGVVKSIPRKVAGVKKVLILVVNDGSTDNTFRKIKSLTKKYKFKLISYEKNRGKGFAVKSGIIYARGDYRLFMDIDLSTPIEELTKFLSVFKKNAVIIGSRRMKEAVLKRRQPFIREFLGKGFTTLSQIILHLDILDFTCGFKCFSRKASVKIFFLQKIDGWGFDSEILFIAKKLGFSIKEIPIFWVNNPGTKVKFPQDIIFSLLDLLRIRLYDFLNKYAVE